MPQILMLNHAAHVNKQRMDVKLEENKDSDSLHDRLESAANDDPIVWRGKRWSQMSSDDMAAYQGEE